MPTLTPPKQQPPQQLFGATTGETSGKSWVNTIFGVVVALSTMCLHPTAGAAPKGFRFSGPEVIKVDWSAHSLHTADFNGDGMLDIVLVNRERSRIQVHYRTAPGEVPKDVKPPKPTRWEPVMDDAPYVIEKLATSIDVTNVASGDFDGDGRLDLAYGSSEDPVFVHFRDKEGFSLEPVELDLEGGLRSYPGALLGKDLDHDGKAELLAHVGKGLRILSFNNRSPRTNTVLHRDNSESSMGLYFADIDRDGREDWIYKSNGSGYGIRTRLATKEGFGPEMAYKFRPGGELIQLGCGLPGKAVPTFVTVEAVSRQIAMFQLSSGLANSGDGEGLSTLSQTLFDTSHPAATFVTADLTGDGLPDIAAASPSDPSVQLYRGLPGGGFEPAGTFPSFGGISQLSAGKFKHSQGGQASLVILSGEEKLVGLSNFENNRRFKFPQAIQVETEPVLASCVDLDADGSDELLVIAKERYDYHLIPYTVGPEGKFTAGPKVELDGIKRTPPGLFQGDLDGDGNLDLLALSSRNPAVILKGDGKGGLKAVAEDSAVRKSMLLGLSPNRLSMADTDGDGKAELLVAGKGYIRAVTMKGDDLEVLDQFNTRAPNDEALCPIVLESKKGKSRELWYYNKEGRFDVLEKSLDGVYRFIRSHEIAPFPMQSFTLRPSGGKGRGEILAFGKHSFRRIPLEPAEGQPKLKILHRFNSEIRDVHHTAVDTADFNSDGSPDLVCLDPSRNVLEFFRLEKDGNTWESGMHFRVFEKNLHVRGERRMQPEPREGLMRDLNGDGKDDFVLLVHDRLLHYYQQ